MTFKEEGTRIFAANSSKIGTTVQSYLVNLAKKLYRQDSVFQTDDPIFNSVISSDSFEVFAHEIQTYHRYFWKQFVFALLMYLCITQILTFTFQKHTYFWAAYG